ncbi:hypothetical protein BSYN_14750 [Bacteroides sedimenti]|uniref:WG repeat-containing protein n=1 Tax=Bacteroides sedimenti TaxID=2136147 RepID=A0ABN6Z3U8_9BACE
MKTGPLKLLLIFVCFLLLQSCSKKEIQFGLYPVKSGDKWGYVDKTGKYIINPQFEYADFFSNGLAVVGIKGENEELKFGYIDEDGKYVINPQYKSALRFKEDIAWVVKDGSAPTAINSKGQESFELKDAELVYSYSEGLALFVVEKDGLFKGGFVDVNGKIVIPATYDKIRYFSNGYAAASNNKNKYGFIDKKGVLVIGYQFDDVSDFDVNGMACVKSGEKWGVIDGTGKYIINPQFSEIRSDGDLFVIKQNEKYGWCDNKGKILINPQFDFVSNFGDNKLASARIGEKWGYLNKEGKWIINPQFKEAYNFVGDLAQINAEGGYGLVDKEGKYVVNPQFDDMIIYNPEYMDCVLSDFFNAEKLVDEIKTRLKDGKVDGLTVGAAPLSFIMNKYSVSEYDLQSISLMWVSDANISLAFTGNFQKKVSVGDSYWNYSYNVFNPQAVPSEYYINIDLSRGKARNKGKIAFEALERYFGGVSGKKDGLNFVLKGDNTTVNIILSKLELLNITAGFTGGKNSPSADYAFRQADSIRIADSIAAAEAAAASEAAATAEAADGTESDIYN